MASVFDRSTSKPVTSNPALENSTASGSPTYPRPMTPTRACLLRIFSRRFNVCLNSACGNGLTRSRRQPLDIGVDHHFDEPFEIDGGAPVQLLTSARRVANQVIHL